MTILDALRSVPFDFQVFEGNIFPADCNYASDGIMFFDLRRVADADCRLHLAEKPHETSSAFQRPFPRFLTELWNHLPTDLTPLEFSGLPNRRFHGEPFEICFLKLPETLEIIQVQAKLLKLALHLLAPDCTALSYRRRSRCTPKTKFPIIWFYQDHHPAGCLAALTSEED